MPSPTSASDANDIGDGEVARQVAAATKVGQIARERGSCADRAAALLAPLRQIVPFQAAWLSVFDESAERYEPVVNHGYDRRLAELFRSKLTVEQIDSLGLNRLRRPLRAHDIPGALADRPVWAQYLLPAGFREGLTIGLFSPDGRHIGMLTLNTDDAAHPTRSARDLIAGLGATIAAVIDPMRTLSATAAMVSTAVAGVALCRSGATLGLPGLPGHRLLTPGSAALAVAAALVRPPTRYARFIHQYDVEEQVQITSIAVPPQPFADIAALVLISPPPDLHGLTHRELEILGFLVDGCSSQHIATALGITVRTVAAHIEHVLLKLGARTRTAAAVRALREGTYVPQVPPRRP